MSWKSNLIHFLQRGHKKELKTGLRQEWVDIHPEGKEDIYHFLFLNKQDQIFIYLFSLDLQSQVHELPWILFLKIIHFHKVRIPEDCFNEIIIHLKDRKIIARDENSMAGLMTAIVEKQDRDFLDHISGYKQELITSIQIAESERLEDQKLFYMNELEKLEPSRFKVNQVVSEDERNRAEKVMERLNIKKRKTFLKAEKVHEIKQEKELIETIKVQARSYHNRGKAQAIDFAYLLRSIGESKLALDFVCGEKDNPKRDWRILDYLFFGNQHVSILDHCEFLKAKYAHDPDALFPVYYAEAIAFWELGEKEKAMNLMSQISSMRPYFKSATKILSQWKEELFD